VPPLPTKTTMVQLLSSIIHKILVFTRRWWWVFALVLVNLVLAVIFPPDYLLLRKMSQHAVQITLAFFVLAILLLILKQTRLMMTSFLCCAALCLHLRSSIGDNEVDRFKYAAATSEVKLRFTQFNTTATDGDYETNIARIIAENPDVISVQEVTPDWDGVLHEMLSEKYPYNRSFRRIDVYGLAVYSKRPFARIDTFHIDKIPNIVGSISIDSLHPDVFFVISHTPPPSDGYTTIRKYMKRVAARIQHINAPIITLADYNVVPWSSEVQEFRETTQLIEGRRSYAPNAPTPTDYILYSKHFNCLQFNALKDSSNASIGVQGDYQFRSDFRALE
jgi:endonuclease/exonuclease/phosphatase (EEP) superfamily protein YafD